MKRLPAIAGEWIDRTRPLRFTFEGRAFQGYAGDTISSALLASGQILLGRSFKYHRPRSVFACANTDVNVLVQVGARMNVRADLEPLCDGLKVEPVNVEFGGLAGDRLRWLDRLSRALPAGFYYKAFHSKRGFPFWERMIRRAAGLGRLDPAAPRALTAKRHAHADVLVVGGGWSGLHAALAAAEEGAQVMLVEECARLGGLAFDLRAGGPGLDALEALIARVTAHPRIRALTAAYAAGYYADGCVPVVTREHMVKVKCKSLVVAQGVWEQPAVFRHNDRPGVMTAGAALRLAHRYAVACGERVLVLTANAEGYAAALDLQALGIEIVAVVDLRPSLGAWSQRHARSLRERGVRLILGCAVYEALVGRDHRVEAVQLARFPSAEPTERLACDTVLVSVGYTPAASLLYQAGARMRYDAASEQFVPAELPAGVFACGRVAGTYDFDAKSAQGWSAGVCAAAHALGRGPAVPVSVAPPAEPPSHPWPIVEHPKGKEFVDFDEDLHLRDLRVAVQEGFDHVELLKRFTTLGMGPSQGKHSNMIGLRVLARSLDQPIEALGTTTARPFYHPVPLGHLAGRGLEPQRRTPLDGDLEALGAVWMPVGAWRRPAYFRRGALTREQCIAEEVAAVRERCGLIDVGTLGKIDVFGPQAAELLERLYMGRIGTLAIGAAQYVHALDEAGVLIEDGVVGRLGEQHFYVTTSTAGSVTFYREMQRWNAIWRLEATLVNLTGQLAAVALAGPRAPQVLQRLLREPVAELPFLSIRRVGFKDELPLGGVEARLLRSGFVGEWAAELHVPASAGTALWRALMAAGLEAGIAPFGVEAQRVLRLEKGHLIVGHDTDGQTTPMQVGIEPGFGPDKPFFVGQRSLRILQKSPPQQVLVGFTLPSTAALPEEGNLVIGDDGAIGGRVTSVARSAALDCTVGLAYVPAAQAAPGKEFTIRLTGARPSVAPTVRATVAKRPFYDRAGRRMREVAAVPMLPPPRLQASVAPALPRLADVPPVPYVAVTALAGARTGFKGPRAGEFAAEAGALPQPNRIALLADGAQLLRLGSAEFLLDACTAPDDASAKALAARVMQVRAGVYPVLREELALLVHGACARDLLLQVCALDLFDAEHGEDVVVMTRVAGVPVIATRHLVHGARAVRLLCDPTWAPYLHATLQELAAEFDRDFDRRGV